MKLIVFSDLHYADKGHYEPRGKKLSQYSEILMEKLITLANNDIKPDACIFLGDFIEDTNDHDLDMAFLKHALSLFKGFKMPVYMIPGNHEFKTLSRTEVAQAMHQCHPTYSVTLNGYHLIFLGLGVEESLAPHNGSIARSRFITNDDIAWLERDLNSNKQPTLIFHHYGIAEDDMESNYWFRKEKEKALLSNRNQLKQIFNKHTNIMGVFSGHQHWTKHLVENGIDYYVVGSLVENIDGLGTPDGVYYIANTNGNNLEVQEHHISL